MTLTVDFDSLPRTFYMPTGGSVTVRFIDKSVTTNGVVNSWAWTFGDTGTASTQNPSHTYTAAGTYDVSLTCNDTGGTGATAVTKTAWIKIEAGTFTPPAATTAFRNISLFVYERSSEAAPKSTVICRNKTAACNLLFMNLQITGAMTKAGKATFDVVNSGGGTSDEIDLFESTVCGRYKNIAIIGGYDVIWSGKITRADKELMSQPGTSPQKAVYHCEAYSDVKKFADWNILAASQGTHTGKSPGQLATLICATNTGEPDFIGTRGGFIDPSGSVLQMTLSDVDKLTAFNTLTAATDYDWRTRMETMLFQYATFDGTNLITITSAGLTIDALIGSWILFPTTNYLASGTSTPNLTGIMAWGIITDNTATTITATLAGAATIPLATDRCLIVQVPRLDFSPDLAETTVVRAFSNNLNVVKFANSDNTEDLFTKAIVRGMDNITGITESVGVAAVTAWDASKNGFVSSTIITKRTQGYVFALSVANKTMDLYGWGWAIKTDGSEGVVAWRFVSGTTYNTGDYVSAASEVSVNGVKVTRVTLATAPSAGFENAIVSVFHTGENGYRIYVKSLSDIGHVVGAAKPDIRMAGGEVLTFAIASIIDAQYGPCIRWLGRSTPGSSTYISHYPGALLWEASEYSESSPAAGSAAATHGIISKSIVAESGLVRSDFEVLASTALIQGSQYYQKSTMTVSYYQFTANRVRDGVQLTGPALIREGQRVSIVPSTGVTAIQRQVIDWTLDANKMTLTVTLGDYIKDVYNTISGSTAATQKALL